MHFSDLGLKAEIQRAVAEQGYDTPTPIQQQAIPAVLAGHDLMATAQTGTGKTAGFTLPILHRLASGPNDRLTRVARTPRVLVLTPTRELAIQVEESVRTYGKHLPINSLAVFGGVGINPQIANLRRGVDILVATPGRLLDHVQQRTVDLSAIEIFVLDEADRMLDMGFIRDIRKIIALLPKERQNLMFSATFSPEIRELAAGLLHNPVSVDVAPRNTAAETVTQKVIETDRERKKELLCHLFATRGWHQVLVFARTKHGADALARTLDKAGIKSAAIHGDKSQGARTRALSEFKDGKLVALVATDIAARGIDIDALPYVINYELPNVPEDYVHRIGRTGRAGMEGEAISLVCHDERAQLKDIEKLIKRSLERVVIEGFEQSAVAKPRPVQPPRGARKPQGQGKAQPKTQTHKSGKSTGRPPHHHTGSRHR
ncbi:DEAD/DEAH box helicase [Dechloromonas agitata]|uniref:DEAD/DEAH box helicase n=1 Tax=Dechloromonas agitata TaxID=73030 RepID=UPI0004BA2BA1|nr:DEAD/DEAH box helicase [Dechloromonas agitata]MDE1547297.1 DEAD/DEAH box helicase [Dechloromonas agitata]